MEIIALIGILVSGAAAAFILKKYDCGVWSLVSAFSSAVAAVYLIGRLSPASEFINELSAYCDGTAVGVLIRCLAVSYIAYFASEVCRSAGEDTVSKTVILAGRCEIIIMVLPLIKDIFSMASEMAGSA